jgi:hypothetical protein
MTRTIPTRHHRRSCAASDRKGTPISIHRENVVRQRQHATTASDPRRRRHVSWSEVHSVTVFDLENDPTTTYRRTMHCRSMDKWRKGVTVPLEYRDLPHSPFDDIRMKRGGSGSPILHDNRAPSTRESCKPRIEGRDRDYGRNMESNDVEEDEFTATKIYTLQSTPPKSMAPSILSGYKLGQHPEHISHMIVPTSCEAGISYASTLRPLDFAFVLRSNGRWSYGIVCHVDCGWEDGGAGEDGTDSGTGICPWGFHPPPSICFVVDFRGSTKSIGKTNWGRKIRLMNSRDEHIEYNACHMTEETSCLNMSDIPVKLSLEASS